MESSSEPVRSVVTTETRGRVAVITLNRPEALNALTVDLVAQLSRAMHDADTDPDIGAIVLAGAGDRAFSVGGDLGDYIPRLTSEGLDVLVDDPTKRFFSDVMTPIVGAARGHCLAGGTEMLLGTDIRIVAADCTIGLPEVRWGLIPAAGSMVRLPRQVPWALAMELLLVGDPISAQRAYEMGLVNAVVESEGVFDRALAVAQQICANGPLAVRAAKEIAVRSWQLEGAFALEYAIGARVFETDDAREGPRAFMEKRSPEFRGT